jgi:hypothetical protein
MLYRSSCPNPNHSPLFNLCEAMILVFLVQICLPCIFTLLLLPVACLCMPSLIRIVGRIDNHASEGANVNTINTIKAITITPEVLASAGSHSSCPICITEMAVGDEARVLPCSHFFHKTVTPNYLDYYFTYMKSALCTVRG